jgi:beta-glucosidase
MMSVLRSDFLWGASTAPHQIEGNNVNSDFWAREPLMPGAQLSGDALDSYHRYREDMELLAEAGLTSYRFGVEWARIEPRPGEFSKAELLHYRRMIDTAIELRLQPVVTLHHFTNPKWFAEEGGWLGECAGERFRTYVEVATSILDGVAWVITMNEPNMLAMMTMMHEAARTGRLSQWQSPTMDGDAARERLMQSMPMPTPEYGRPFVDAHRAVSDLVRKRTGAKVGWSVANKALTALPGGEQKLTEVSYAWEDMYLQACAGDDFVGVQAYSAQSVDERGILPHEPHPDNTLVGTAYRPDALGIALWHTWEVTGLPILVTENGIATGDDNRRIGYTAEALRHLLVAVDGGVDVRGYLHWSALDNYEWDTGSRPSV